MIVSARCSFRCSRRCSASSCFTRGSTGRGLGPRRRPRMSCKAPCSRCRRQLVSKDEYNPSRRNRAPSSPGFLQASACVRMRSRYSAGKRRRWAFAGTSGSGSVARDVTEGPKAAVALRAPSASAPRLRPSLRLLACESSIEPSPPLHSSHRGGCLTDYWAQGVEGLHRVDGAPQPLRAQRWHRQRTVHVCSSEGYDCSATKKGARLGVSKDYFSNAHEVVYEIAAKFSHVLWRKLSPEDRERGT